MTDEEITAQANSLFHATGGQARWGEAWNCSYAEWQGRRLIWPEGAEVVDLDRACVLTTEELPEVEVLKLPWRPIEGWSPESACMPGPLL